MKCCLYWVTTEDHGEDWFIFALNKRSAESYHVGYEGYDTGDATAELILRGIDIPDRRSNTQDERVRQMPRHAWGEDLKPLGFTILDDNSAARIVEYKGRIFAEGFMEAMLEAARAQGTYGVNPALAHEIIVQKSSRLPRKQKTSTH